MKQLYALVCEAQRYAAVLDAVIERAGLLRAEKKLRPHLAQVRGCGVRPRLLAETLGWTQRVMLPGAARARTLWASARPGTEGPGASPGVTVHGGRSGNHCLVLAPPRLLPRAQVLVYELLLGRGFRGGGGRWKPVLDRHQARLKAELARLKVQRGVSRNEDLLDAGAKPDAGELEPRTGGPGGWAKAGARTRLLTLPG